MYISILRLMKSWVPSEAVHRGTARVCASGSRKRIQDAVGPNEAPMSVVAFPLMGVGDFTLPSTTPGAFI